MKKLIFVLLCISLMNCKKNNDTSAPVQTDGTISFTANAQTVTYTGKITQTNGIGTGVSEVISSPILYYVAGAKSVNDFFQMHFANSVKLTSGQVDFNNGGVADISYFKGDSLYISNGTGFVITFSSFANDKLNGTFSGILRTQYGTAITISNGQMINVPVIK